MKRAELEHIIRAACTIGDDPAPSPTTLHHRRRPCTIADDPAPSPTTLHHRRRPCTIADDDELIIIRSQAILAQYPSAPADLTLSLEADVYPKNHPERAELIDGAMGELSMFHQTFGYYADGVAETTATLPAGWSSRLVPICNSATLGKTGWCLEVHDLLIAKYTAGREKDRRCTAAAARHGMATRAVLSQRLDQTEIGAEVRERVRAAIARDFAAG